MAISIYKLKPHQAKQDVRGAFLKAAMLATTTTTGSLFAVSAIYLIINYTFIQIGQVPDILLVVAFFGSGILFIWTFGNFWAEVIGGTSTESQRALTHPPVQGGFDPVAQVHEWVQKRLVRLEIRQWSDLSPEKKDENIEYSGLAEDQHGILHPFTAVMTKDGIILNDRSTVR